MEIQRILAIVLIIAGALGLAYGGFSYTKATHTADVGALHMSLDEHQHVNVPAWAGISLIIVGGVLLLVGRKN